MTAQTSNPTAIDILAVNLDPESYDFLELVSFAWKAQWEGSFDYTWDNYPPVFQSPHLIALETKRSRFKTLLNRYRSRIAEWEYAVGPEQSTKIINAHRKAHRTERDRRCLWAVKFANGNISCERSEETARWLGGNASWGYPAVLYRKSADQDWQEIAPLGPKT